MTKKISLYTIALMMYPPNISAQSISMVSDGDIFPIQQQQTQTEVKPGWKIVDMQLKSKMVRYLWGTKAKQFTDNVRPQFIVDSDTLLLSDMVLIKLDIKKEYRKIPKPEIQQNKYISLDFSTFSVEAYGEESFLIQPIQELEKGEYIFTWKTRQPIGELADWVVWPFSIQ